MKELTALAVLIPLQPRILAVVEASQSSLNHFKALGLLANTNYITRLHLVRGDTYNIAIDDNVLVVDKLTSSSTSRSNSKTEDDIVKTALQVLKKHLTSDTVSLGCSVEHVVELTLQNAIGVLCLLLLSKLSTILRHLTTTVIAVLPRGEVATGKNLIFAENGLAKTACNSLFRTYVSCHNKYMLKK